MAVVFTKRLKRIRRFVFFVDKYNRGKPPIKKRI